MSWSWEIFIAIGGLIVSGIAAWIAYGAKKDATAAGNHANSLQETIVKIEKKREADRQIEKQKANLAITLDHRDVRGAGWISDILIVENTGRCEARNVIVRITRSEDKSFEKTYSFEVIAPNSDCKMALNFTVQNMPPYLVSVTWDDDFAKGRVMGHSITLY